jgi:hypothetical protein
MKKIITSIVILLNSTFMYAQSSNSSQQVSMGVSGTIELTFTGSGTATGNNVNLSFSTVNDYANGVISATQELKIVSNRNFSVAVKTNNTNFTYSGSASPSPSMPVSGVLSMLIASNSTGGSLVSPFSTAAYAGLTSSSQNMISSGTAGNNQLFSVKYKAMPGFAYPAGTYTVNVLFTATQL